MESQKELNENTDLIEKEVDSKNNKKVIWFAMVIIPVIIAILSFAVFSGYATSAKLHSETIQSLQEKQGETHGDQSSQIQNRWFLRSALRFRRRGGPGQV